MANSMKSRKTTEKYPHVDLSRVKDKKKLPGLPIESKRLAYLFSFEFLDRTHPLFNLGTDIGKEKAIDGSWFLDWLDRMKDVSLIPKHELKATMFELHPIDWANVNVAKPEDADQREYCQFRINKSKGRVIGFHSHDTFFIIWLDPHHNISDSDGYGKAVYYKQPLSTYEQMVQLLEEKDREIERLNEEIDKLLAE